MYISGNNSKLNVPIVALIRDCCLFFLYKGKQDMILYLYLFTIAVTMAGTSVSTAAAVASWDLGRTSHLGVLNLWKSTSGKGFGPRHTSVHPSFMRPSCVKSHLAVRQSMGFSWNKVDLSHSVSPSAACCIACTKSWISVFWVQQIPNDAATFTEAAEVSWHFQQHLYLLEVIDSV